MMFLIQSEYEGREALAVVSYALKNNLAVKYLPIHAVPNRPLDANEIPVGSVEFVENCLKTTIKPDYFPEFVKPLVRRKVLEGRLFFKPTDRYKRFTGFIDELKDIQVQELATWDNEFRHYITNGKEVAWGWYKGCDEEAKAPNLTGLQIPYFWCGTIDIGTYTNEHGGIGVEVIECHHPFSCGWYGEKADGDKYVEWLINGWKYMKGIQ